MNDGIKISPRFDASRRFETMRAVVRRGIWGFEVGRWV